MKTEEKYNDYRNKLDNLISEKEKLYDKASVSENPEKYYEQIDVVQAKIDKLENPDA